MVTDDDVYDSKAWVTFQALKISHDSNPCKHGHIGCSYKEGGPCSNEVFNNIFQSLTEAQEFANDKTLYDVDDSDIEQGEWIMIRKSEE